MSSMLENCAEARKNGLTRYSSSHTSQPWAYSMAAKLREQFSIPNKPRNLKDTRADWERDVPVWIKLAVDLGIKLD